MKVGRGGLPTAGLAPVACGAAPLFADPALRTSFLQIPSAYLQHAPQNKASPVYQWYATILRLTGLDKLIIKTKTFPFLFCSLLPISVDVLGLSHLQIDRLQGVFV